MGRQKSLFSGALIGPNSLFCFTLIACNFEFCAAHRRSLLLQEAAAQDASRTAVHESSGAGAHGKLNVKHYRTTPKPKTHTTRQVVLEKEAALWREKKRIQAAQPPLPATQQQATQLLGGTCTSMAASCCCCCHSVLLLL